MPRKRVLAAEPEAPGAAESIAPAAKKRTASKKTASGATATKPRAAGKSVAAPKVEKVPKRAARPKSPGAATHRAGANGTRAAARAAKRAPFDSGAHYEEIARLAYHYWEERGGAEGSPEQDWFRAEAEVFRATSSSSV